MGKGNFLPILTAALLVIVAAGFFLFKPQLRIFTQLLPSPTPSIVQSDIPALFSEIAWKLPANSQVTFDPGSHYESEILDKYPDDFVSYYREELLERGWSEYAVAGKGPGDMGEDYVYTKGERRIEFGVYSTSPGEYQTYITFR